MSAEANITQKLMAVIMKLVVVLSFVSLNAWAAQIVHFSRSAEVIIKPVGLMVATIKAVAV
jgi:hypothetical protein